MATREMDNIDPHVCVYCGSTKASPMCTACCFDGHLESAELARLRAELADEKRAVERLSVKVDELAGKCPLASLSLPACPPNTECTQDTAACWAAWGRNKETEVDE